MPRNDTFSCPHCGEQVHKNARACPHCGSDDTTGWSDNTYLDGIDLPDDEEYGEIHEREFGKRSSSGNGKMWIALTALVIIIAFAAGIIAALR
jgi:uncharacterized membrane protein YvbJ